MMRRLGLALLALLLGGFLFGMLSDGTPVRVLVARTILTLDPERPEVQAVAIEDGRILARGSLDEVRATLGERSFEIDRRFAEDVLIAGFVDPHIHPTLAATILGLEILSAVSWETPDGPTLPVPDREAFLRRLRELDSERPEGQWLLTWGYHEPYHGEITRRDLDSISTDRPIFVWQRSVHEMFLNTAALEELGLEESALAADPQADWEDGHLWEQGMMRLGQPMVERLTEPIRYLEGLGKMTEVLHRGGLTTVGEQGFPQVNALAERLSLLFEMWRSDAPYRFVLVPNAMFLLRTEGSADRAVTAAQDLIAPSIGGLLGGSTDALRTVRHAKYYADGAIFSQLMQMTEPYLDGHHGEWMVDPADQAALLDAFWGDGWDIHIHVNGDAGLDLVLDQVAARRAADPSGERQVVLEHYGYAREDQHRRVRDLDVLVSNNPYYLHELAPIYARHGLGPERASDISPLGGLARAGVPVSFHSDFPMAPAKPLTLVWVAVNRIATDGAVWGEDQRFPLDAALAAVTIEAARSLGLEDEIGSIEVGKRADFTVLDRSPYEVEPEALREIEVLGTILDGRWYPVESGPRV